MPAGDYPTHTHSFASHTHSIANHNHNIMPGRLDPEYPELFVGDLPQHTHGTGGYSWGSTTAGQPLFHCAHCRQPVFTGICTMNDRSYCTLCWSLLWDRPLVTTEAPVINSAWEADKAEIIKLKEQLNVIKGEQEILLTQLDYHDQQIEKLEKFILKEVPNEPSQSQGAIDTAIRIIKEFQDSSFSIQEGDLVTDITTNAGPFHAIRETIVDITTDCKTHRMPGWVVKNQKGQYIELPTTVLDFHDQEEAPVVAKSDGFLATSYFILEMAAIAYVLYALLDSINIIIQ